MDYIYADNAATTRPSPLALSVMTDTLRGIYGNPSSLHGPGQEASCVLEEARRTVAACLHASPCEICFTSGGSEADVQALLSGAAWGRARGKRHLVSTRIEHPAVLRTLEALGERGFAVTLVAPGEDGIVRTEAVERAIRPDTALVSVMAANNEVGTIQPIAEIGAVCRSRGILFHTDAVQAAGHIPLDVGVLRTDLLSLSAHKFHGPKGAGALFVRDGIPAFRLIAGGRQEGGRRAGTENVPGIASMAAALEEAVGRMEEDGAYVGRLCRELDAGLEGFPGVRLNGDRESRLPGNRNYRFEGVEGESLVLLLDSRGIAVSSGSACASGEPEPSHVLLAMGLSPEQARGSVRITLDRENTREEAVLIARSVREAVAFLREVRIP